MYFSIFGGPEEICGGCPVRFVGSPGTVYATSAASGYFSVSLTSATYAVEYSCPSVLGGVFWVRVGTVVIPAVASYGVDIITEGCL